MRKEKITINEYYHLYNRGVNKQVTFLDEGDYSRFFFLLLYFQSPKNFYNLGRYTKHYVKHRVFNIGKVEKDTVVTDRYVELLSFCIMPNHFHLLVKEKEEGGIARYMQRVLNSYTKYFNTKYQKSGHVFQGPYQYVYIENDEQLLYLSAYIHRNPRVLNGWLDKEHAYPWSSYQDYIGPDRFPDILKKEIILNSFNNGKEYQKFVQSSTAKVTEGEIEDLLIKD